MSFPLEGIQIYGHYHVLIAFEKGPDACHYFLTRINVLI